MTTKDFYTLTNEMRKKYPQMRYGQALFNTLYEVNPDLANKIRSTKIDPFYKKDNELYEFFAFLDKQLKSN